MSRTAGIRLRQSEASQALSSAAVKALGTSDGQMVFGYSREESKRSMWGMRMSVWLDPAESIDICPSSVIKCLVASTPLVSCVDDIDPYSCLDLASPPMACKPSLTQQASKCRLLMLWAMTTTAEMKNVVQRSRACMSRIGASNFPNLDAKYGRPDRPPRRCEASTAGPEIGPSLSSQFP